MRAFLVENSLEACSSGRFWVKSASTVHLLRCGVGSRGIAADQVTEVRDITIVLFESPAEKMAALVVCDEIQVAGLRRRKRGAERRLARICDGPWRQASVQIGVIRRFGAQVLWPDSLHGMACLFER